MNSLIVLKLPHLHSSIKTSNNSHLSQLQLYLTITMEVELHYSLHDYCFLQKKKMSFFMSLHSWVNWFCRLRLNVWGNQCSLHCVYIIWLSCGWIQHPRHRELQQLLGPQQRILSWYWLMLGRLHTLDHASPFIQSVLHSILTSHHHRGGQHKIGPINYKAKFSPFKHTLLLFFNVGFLIW